MVYKGRSTFETCRGHRILGAILLLAIGISVTFLGAASSGRLLAAGETVTPTVTPSGTPVFMPAGSSNAGWTPVIREKNKIPMAYVPAGCFLMGSEAGDEDERPIHDICLPAFWIGQTEVTNAQYAACVNAGHCQPPLDPAAFEDPAFGDHPVVSITWHQAARFAAWLGCSLPAETQWEYAARGPESWQYPWGNGFEGTRLNFCDVNCVYDWRDPDQNDGHTGTAPAGSYPEGAAWVGALDMSGNVWEWVSTIYRTYPYVAVDGREDFGDTLNARVVRGGSYASYYGYTRAASRDFDSPHLRFVVVGFRIVCTSPAFPQ
jgi:formylglycine-generating enzyme required for sulfatase activity